LHDLLGGDANLDNAKNVRPRLPKNLQGIAPRRAVDPVLGDSSRRTWEEALAVASSTTGHISGHRGVKALRGAWSDLPERDEPQAQEVAECLRNRNRLSSPVERRWAPASIALKPLHRY